MLFYIWLAVIVLALWLYSRQFYSRYPRHGVKTVPGWEAWKHGIRTLSRREHFSEDLDSTYRNFPGERFVGRYEFSSHLVLIRDIELMKRVTVKDFEHFTDHRSIVNETTDPLFGRNLFSLRGHEWKDMRSTLSPAFTSSKIRLMVPFMVEVGKQMIESLKKKIQNSDNDYIDVDIKDMTCRYSNDVIASCAFGLNVDSHTDENNQFYTMGKAALNFASLWTFVKFILLFTVPRLMAKLKLSLFTEETKTFFKSMVLDTMKDREARNIIRPDMIHLLMEAKKGKLVHDDKSKEADVDAGFATVEESNVGKRNIQREWSDNDLVAQAILFFIAGFDAVATAASFALHELAVNPEIQVKLVQEIRETEQMTGGKLDYKTIQSMKYMDMVVSETLRLWPSAVQFDRMCVKDYNLGKASDDPAAKDYYVRAGETLVIPLFSIHRDPEYYPDPLKFDPERFSEENIHKIRPYTFVPFGIGPRNCIGSRFALCEVKVMLYQLLQHIEVSPNEKTCIPSKLNTKIVNFGLAGGHWLRLKIRQE